MNKWVKNGLILTATLGLLVVFAPKDGPPHQINPVIEKRTKATADEKKYNKEIAGDFLIRLAKNPDSLALTAGLRFPAFFKVKNKKPIYKWSNDQFNVLTIDRIENTF